MRRLLQPLLPARLRVLLPLSCTAILVSVITRIALALRPEVNLTAAAGDAFLAFVIGVAYDWVTVTWLLLPWVLWLVLIPNRIARGWWYRTSVVLLYWISAFLMLFVAAAEWTFWEEFGARFNFIAVDYLLYTHEVIANIRQSYPLGWILFALATIAVLLCWPVRHWLWRQSGEALPKHTGVLWVPVYAALLVMLWIGVRADLKDRSSHDALNELAGNGAFQFFSALRRNELQYDRFYRTLPDEKALALVREGFAHEGGTWLADDGTERPITPTRAATPRHVILVSIESMGAEFLGVYGNRQGITPALDGLATQSLWLSDVYATGNRTVRGLEALSLALPPTPGQSIVRRPGNAQLFSVGAVLRTQGYDSVFAYGGYGYFDNMNAYFSANGYRVFDRVSIPKERAQFENAWGVADEYLFDQVLDEMDRATQAPQDAQTKLRPQFMHVLTTSNHRPYTYPEGRIDIPSGTGRDGAVKYSDWAVGEFLRKAKSHAWFEQTVFVITADHGANARGTTEIPVDRYRIPVFIYAPGWITPQRFDRLASQIDLAPTLLSLLGVKYNSKFFGRDVLSAPPETDRAFVGNFQTLAYLKPGRMAVLQPKRVARVLAMDAQARVQEPIEDAAMIDEAIAYYQTSSRLFRMGLYAGPAQPSLR